MRNRDKILREQNQDEKEERRLADCIIRRRSQIDKLEVEIAGYIGRLAVVIRRKQERADSATSRRA